MLDMIDKIDVIEVLDYFEQVVLPVEALKRWSVSLKSA